MSNRQERIRRKAGNRKKMYVRYAESCGLEVRLFDFNNMLGFQEKRDPDDISTPYQAIRLRFGKKPRKMERAIDAGIAKLKAFRARQPVP